ncbi:MAG: arylsulfatase [Oscillospiraceae bacterium]|nr:arylsulfatase [Oscillospiraceae bacterium]
MNKRPNIVFVLTDDQGYPDLGCTGNPYIQTPNIDEFHKESARLNDFHVAPLCAPTRGALLTGRRPTRNGVWATCWGRSLLSAGELTLSEVLQANGYATGMFGKWHLGDNYPYRPQDRGFERVVAHKGGGVGQTPDFWGNNYFDDTYFHNGKPIKHTGYCTDIWFDEAMKFIREKRDAPFFAYIATNAPHEPYLVDEKYTAHYRGTDGIIHPEFYGMIENIDENFGKLRALLKELEIEDDTLLVFMTDNGSSGSARLDENQFVTRGYNAGMRGMKGSYYDGGHRVPCLMRWPGGKILNREVGEICFHIDFMPTLLDLCGIEPPEGAVFDGAPLGGLLRGDIQRLDGERVDFVQYRQYTEPPRKWENAVITREYRLINGRELYNIKKDPGQRRDISGSNPGMVEQMRALHEEWWREVAPGLDDYCHIAIGSDMENPTRLDAMDVMGDVAWNQNQIAAAQISTGKWNVDVCQTGRYRISLRRWPEEFPLKISDICPQEELDKLAPYQKAAPKAVNPKSAKIKLFEAAYELPVNGQEREVTFEIEAAHTGQTVLEAWFIGEDNQKQGAYYVYIERLIG